MILDFLLQRAIRPESKAADLLPAVTFTLTKMARGGMYDQLGGGFHRYSTDDEWLAPHFEKMLYDNAQLARTYLHAWQVTADPFFRQIVEETLDYVLREMTSPEGAFYSTQDADSEGQEGKFFVWTRGRSQPSRSAEEDAPACSRATTALRSAATGGKAAQGANILHVAPRGRGVARRPGRDARAAAARPRSAVARVLLEAREPRVHPGRDEKVLAEWNGLMLAALCGGRRGPRPGGLRQTQRSAMPNSCWRRCATPSECETSCGLFRTYKDGRAHLNAYLEDYASVALGLAGVVPGRRSTCAGCARRPSWQKSCSTASTTSRAAASSRRPKTMRSSSPGARTSWTAPSPRATRSLPICCCGLQSCLTARTMRSTPRPRFSLMAGGMAEQPLAFGRLFERARLLPQSGLRDRDHGGAVGGGYAGAA